MGVFLVSWWPSCHAGQAQGDDFDAETLYSTGSKKNSKISLSLF